MNIARLHEILRETTVQLRKGETLEGTTALVDAIKRGDEDLPGGVAEFYCMPHEADADLVKVDCEFLVIGVDKAKANDRRAELVSILDTYPNPDRLAGGPSYIEVGDEIGDQGAAFQLFALGKVLGLWDVITPATMGLTGSEARQLAGSGFVMITGYRSQKAAA